MKYNPPEKSLILSVINKRLAKRTVRYYKPSIVTEMKKTDGKNTQQQEHLYITGGKAKQYHVQRQLHSFLQGETYIKHSTRPLYSKVFTHEK